MLIGKKCVIYADGRFQKETNNGIIVCEPQLDRESNFWVLVLHNGVLIRADTDFIKIDT